MTFAIGTPNRHNAGHYLSYADGVGHKQQEADIKTCPHCQAVIMLKKESGDYCSKCQAPVCPTCAARMDLYGCEPFLRKLERYIGAQEQYEKFLKEAGVVSPVPPQPIFTGLLKG